VESRHFPDVNGVNLRLTPLVVQGFGWRRKIPLP
jgi:hypothetical protein